ncbi:MAG: pilus assembly protein [Nitrospirae bacterium]|nr:pilus assembly protein [Nitrospirota bacterium]
MKRTANREGQTVIETAILMILILMLFFGIAEIARAWWYKGQLNNAARVGARVAIVTPSLTLPSSASCSSSAPVVAAACAAITSSDLRSSASVNVACSINTTCSSPAAAGDSITVSVSGVFTTVVPGMASLAGSLVPDSTTLTAQMAMRHE